MASLMPEYHSSAKAFELEDADISDAGAEEPMSRAYHVGTADRGARRIAAAVFAALLTGAALLAAWDGSSRLGGASALRRGGVGSSTGLEQLEEDPFDFYNHAFAFSEPHGQSRASDPAAYVHVHGGSLCDEDEEMFEKLCYKKCSLLTQGQYSKRTSAWSCGNADASGMGGIFDQKFKARICGGYDVSGDRTGNGCPHLAGACLENEELHLGRCFKKCSLLTGGEYPTRVAAATCCKATEEWKCLDIMNVKTRRRFDVGGGEDGGYRGPHFPKAALAEQK